MLSRQETLSEQALKDRADGRTVDQLQNEQMRLERRGKVSFEDQFSEMCIIPFQLFTGALNIWI